MYVEWLRSVSKSNTIEIEICKQEHVQKLHEKPCASIFVYAAVYHCSGKAGIHLLNIELNDTEFFSVCSWFIVVYKFNHMFYLHYLLSCMLKGIRTGLLKTDFLRFFFFSPFLLLFCWDKIFFEFRVYRARCYICLLQTTFS